MIKLSVIIPVYNQEELLVRAIESIPDTPDIEVIVIDDGSIDNTLTEALNAEKSRNNVYVYINPINQGISYTVNRGYDLAQGEYIVLLGSDDYFYTDELIKAIKLLNGEDLIYFDLRTNDGTIFHLTKENKTGYCGSVKFMRREFVGKSRCPLDVEACEDWYFYKELLLKMPKEKFTGIVLKHYNFPRKGSLSWLARNNKLKC